MILARLKWSFDDLKINSFKFRPTELHFNSAVSFHPPVAKPISKSGLIESDFMKDIDFSISVNSLVRFKEDF
jgi:hypothetical protein